LVDARTNAVAVGRDDLCEICTETEVADATNIAASALKVALDRSLRPVAPAPILAPPTDDGAASRRANEPPAWRRALPWVAFGASAAALGTGVYFWSLNGGTKTEGLTPNNRLYDTVWVYALPLVGVGVAAAVVGVLTLPPGKPAPHAAEQPAPGRPATSPTPRTQGFLVGPGSVAAWATF
jgi:hypothetical protein